ncbi:MAG: hypothetical protein WD181_03530 [Solirubrobacterales bacterium]
MSDRTKLILAVTLGSVGLALGTLGTLVAFNTKNEVKSNQEVTSVVQSEFAKSQKRQDEREASQASEAEKLVASLSRAEKSLLVRINGNVRSVVALRRKLRRQESQFRRLNSADQQLASEVDDLQTQIERNYSVLNDRINELNQRVNRLQAGGVNP